MKLITSENKRFFIFSLICCKTKLGLQQKLPYYTLQVFARIILAAVRLILQLPNIFIGIFATPLEYVI